MIKILPETTDVIHTQQPLTCADRVRNTGGIVPNLCVVPVDALVDAMLAVIINQITGHPRCQVGISQGDKSLNPFFYVSRCSMHPAPVLFR